MTTRIFLIDDHELVRDGVRLALDGQSGLEVVGTAATAAEGLEAVRTVRPDLVIVDLMASDAGLHVCRELDRERPPIRCLVLSSVTADGVVVEAIRAGVSGYLLKRAPAQELVRAVQIAAGGGSLIDPGLSARLVERVRDGHVGGDPSARLAGLSPQERRLLDLLGEGLSNREIAARMELAEKTIKNYVSGVLRKLDMRSRTEAAVFVTSLRLART